jgi:hypothetical protein
MSFVVNKTVFTNSSTGELIIGLNDAQAIELQKEHAAGNHKIEILHNSIDYKFFSNKNGFLRTYDQDFFETSPFDEWTETRFFEPSNIQESMFREYSNTLWDITDATKVQMAMDMYKSFNKPQPNLIANFSLAIDFTFERALPAEAKKATHRLLKEMNYTLEPDCLSGL